MDIEKNSRPEDEEPYVSWIPMSPSAFFSLFLAAVPFLYLVDWLPEGIDQQSKSSYYTILRFWMFLAYFPALGLFRKFRFPFNRTTASIGYLSVVFGAVLQTIGCLMLEGRVHFMIGAWLVGVSMPLLLIPGLVLLLGATMTFTFQYGKCRTFISHLFIAFVEIDAYVSQTDKNGQIQYFLVALFWVLRNYVRPSVVRLFSCITTVVLYFQYNTPHPEQFVVHRFPLYLLFLFVIDLYVVATGRLSKGYIFIMADEIEKEKKETQEEEEKTPRDVHFMV